MWTINRSLCIEALHVFKPAHLFLFRAEFVFIAPYSSDWDVLADLVELDFLGVFVGPEPPVCVLLEFVIKLELSHVLSLLSTNLFESPLIAIGSDSKIAHEQADIGVVASVPTDCIYSF